MEEAREEIIFGVVANIIAAAEREVQELLMVSEKKNYSDNEEIHDEIKILYDRALSIFENAKEEITQKWKRVNLSNRYALQLGYEKTIKDITTKLMEVKRLQSQIKEIENRYSRDIEANHEKMRNGIESLKRRLNYDDLLKEKNKEKVTIEVKNDKIKEYLSGK